MRSWLLAIVLCVASSMAMADPGYYVVTPYNNDGVRTVDFRYWTFKGDGWPQIRWPEIGFGYGVNSRWTTELFVSYIGSSAMATRPSTINWQNDYLLTQGQYPYDLALHLQLINDRYQHENRHAYEFGPVFQTDIGHTQVTTNLFVFKGTGPRFGGPTEMKYQWQLRYRWRPELHFGAQGFGELGKWNDWSPSSQQSHRAGPALFTHVRFSDTQVVKLQAAYLMGKTYGVRGDMFTMQAAFEF